MQEQARGTTEMGIIGLEVRSKSIIEARGNRQEYYRGKSIVEARSKIQKTREQTSENPPSVSYGNGFV